jgi:hypothetical protein
VNNCSYVRGFCNKGITNPHGVFSGETCTIGAELIKYPQHCTIYIYIYIYIYIFVGFQIPHNEIKALAERIK